jgi:hypothetical protein
MQQVQQRPSRLAARAPRSPTAISQDLREARRTANRGQVGGDLRCECGRPACQLVVPAAAEVHRGTRGGFLVVPGHQFQEVVVAAADRYFVVEDKRGLETS